jgi:hypothetical protein
MFDCGGTSTLCSIQWNCWNTALQASIYRMDPWLASLRSHKSQTRQKNTQSSCVYTNCSNITSTKGLANNHPENNCYHENAKHIPFARWDRVTHTIVHWQARSPCSPKNHPGTMHNYTTNAETEPCAMQTIRVIYDRKQTLHTTKNTITITYLRKTFYAPCRLDSKLPDVFLTRKVAMESMGYPSDQHIYAYGFILGGFQEDMCNKRGMLIHQ